MGQFWSSSRSLRHMPFCVKYDCENHEANLTRLPSNHEVTTSTVPKPCTHRTPHARICSGRLVVMAASQSNTNTRMHIDMQVFFGKAPSPSDVHRSGKAQELLGYVPYDTLDEFSSRPKL